LIPPAFALYALMRSNDRQQPARAATQTVSSASAPAPVAQA